MLDIAIKAMCNAFGSLFAPKTATQLQAPMHMQQADIPLPPKKEEFDLADAMLNPRNPWYGMFDD